MRKWAGVIYVLTNLVNEMKYVGMTTQYDERQADLPRWRAHVYAAINGGSQLFIHRAIRKYGVENFSAEVVRRCQTRRLLLESERSWIKKLRTFGPLGYNLTLGGEGTKGATWKDKPATKRRKSKAMLLHWSDEGRRTTHILSMRTEESRSKASASQKARFAAMTEEDLRKFGKKLSRAQKKRYAEPGAIEKMVEGQRKRFADPVKKAANRDAHRTEEYRAKQAAGRARQMADPKTRNRWLASQRTPEQRARRRVVTSAWHADAEKQAKFLASSRSKECREKHSKSAKLWYEDQKNRAQHLKSHQSKAFRERKANDTKKFFAAMAPEERKAYWHRIHPNGNGHGKKTRAEKP